ncbi:YihY/virulence factor BrkB family protein [Natronosalvus halobius]|uniref:YihY/virulence factor BrkB family protein n=1 Tax=Natronosalvus halobius TaxID=2953746 RepID=UPI0020A11FF8|nr:YihY/virulence factor BrkB family protein [Natronosalvus halobius]USZ72656.1 YihY/virulence factor BrkB family protein [Natronosalvus halobius]
MSQLERSLPVDESTARRVVAVARENGFALVAAGVAFYIFNALIPLAIFALIGMTTVGWLESALELLAPAFGADPESLVSTMNGMIGEGSGRGRAAVIAAAMLAWSAFTTFQSINRAFGHVYGVQAERSPRQTARDTGLILVTVILAVASVIVVQVGVVAVAGQTVALLASIPLLAGALFAVFLPMFYQFAPPAVTVREALPGAVLTAISWTLGAIGFRLYLTTSESVELYGVAGGIMLLLTWLYVGALALLGGVILNAVMADRVEAEDRWAIG